MDLYKQFEIREGLVFLVELSAAIFQPVEQLDYRSQFQEILSSINELISELIITSHNTGVGIYLYNCTTTSEKFKSDSTINSIFSLNDLNSKNMKYLNDLIEDDVNGIKLFEKHFTPNDKPAESIPVVLNTILNEFNSKPHYNNKKLIWVTNNDNPYNDDNTKRRLWKIINDYDEYRINISPILLDKFSGGEVEKFDMTKFQNIFLNSGGIKQENEVKEEANDDDNEVDTLTKYINEQVRKAKVKQATLSTRIRTMILRLREIRRVQFNCDLILSDGGDVGGNLGCSIKGYTMYNHEKPRRYESMYNKDEESKLVHVKTRYVNENTNEEINKDERVEDDDDGGPTIKDNIKKGYPIGDLNVLYVNDRQLNFLKNYTFDHTPNSKRENLEGSGGEAAEGAEIDDEEADDLLDENVHKVTISKAPYLKLLGFRRINHFNPFFNTSNPIFITPDLNNGLRSSSLEGGFQNSFTTFSSLYQSCVSLKRFAVVFGCLKKNAIPSLYCLYPTRVDNSTKYFGDKSYRLFADDFPQGFFLIRLPWVEDIRSLPEYVLRKNGQYLYNAEKSSDKLFQDLVKQYKYIFNEFGLLHYQPVDFPNPSLNFFYKILRMHLLQIEDNEAESEAGGENEILQLVENDSTVKKLVDLHNYIYEVDSKLKASRGDLIKNLNSSLNSISNSESIREQPKDVKRAKIEIELTDADVVTAWKSEGWQNFNVSQLRGFIAKHKQIAKATRRADMIDNIKTFLENKFGSIEK